MSVLALVPGLRWLPITALVLAMLALLWAIQLDARRVVELRAVPCAAARPFVVRLLVTASAAAFSAGIAALLALR